MPLASFLRNQDDAFFVFSDLMILANPCFRLVGLVVSSLDILVMSGSRRVISPSGKGGKLTTFDLDLVSLIASLASS